MATRTGYRRRHIPEGRLLGRKQLMGSDGDASLSYIYDSEERRQALKDAYVRALRAKGVPTQAARSVGVPLKTIRAWQVADEFFNEECIEAYDAAIDRAEERMVGLLDAKSEIIQYNASKFLLERRRRDQYAPRIAIDQKVQHTGISYESRVPRAKVIDVHGVMQDAPKEIDS